MSLKKNDRNYLIQVMCSKGEHFPCSKLANIFRKAGAQAVVNTDSITFSFQGHSADLPNSSGKKKSSDLVAPVTPRLMTLTAYMLFPNELPQPRLSA